LIGRCQRGEEKERENALLSKPKKSELTKEKGEEKGEREAVKEAVKRSRLQAPPVSSSGRETRDRGERRERENDRRPQAINGLKFSSL
jgi:hypothetical protein